MAKLYFRYGAMNSGKSTNMLQAAYNYEERGQQVLLAKPQIDTKGDAEIVSRLGVRRPVDFVISADDDLWELFASEREQVESATGKPVNCLLVDEAQFLTETQVDDMLRIAILANVPVLAYGIRTDFQTVAFPGSRRLLEIAHSLEELKTARLSSTRERSAESTSSTEPRLPLRTGWMSCTFHSAVRVTWRRAAGCSTAANEFCLNRSEPRTITARMRTSPSVVP